VAIPDGEYEQRRSEFVSAAIELVRDDGLLGLTMRKLAARMDVSAMTAYRYFDNKADLLGAIVERIWTDVLDAMQSAASTTPTEKAIRSLLAVRRVVVSYGDAGILAGSATPPQALLHVMETGAATLRAIGFDEARIPTAQKLLGLVALGSAVLESSAVSVARLSGDRFTPSAGTDEECEQTLRLLLNALMRDAELKA
jgi:TetR/AcrR family transcriptional regulator, tetracycline repressor protein